MKFSKLSDGLKIKTRIQRPWRRQLKSSQSDGESSVSSSRNSTESDVCSCDNGFVLVDESVSKSSGSSVDEKDPPKSPRTS